MTDGEGGRIGGRRHYGFARTILAALALGTILCAVPIMAQTAPPPQDAAPVEPAMEEPKSPPRITDALLPSALPRDLSPWGMFLNAVPIVKIVMVGLAFASLVTWTVWLAKTIELWNARRLARQGLEVLASAKSLRAAEKDLAQVRSPVARFVAAAVDEADRSNGLAPEGVKDRARRRQGPRRHLAVSHRSASGTGHCPRTSVLATIGATARLSGTSFA